jgi:hypothetical protein
VLGLVLDEPTERDKIQEVGELKFLMDRELESSLGPYLPLQVDYDDRFWFGVRVRASRGGGC